MSDNSPHDQPEASHHDSAKHVASDEADDTRNESEQKNETSTQEHEGRQEAPANEDEAGGDQDGLDQPSSEALVDQSKEFKRSRRGPLGGPVSSRPPSSVTKATDPVDVELYRHKVMEPSRCIGVFGFGTRPSMPDIVVFVLWPYLLLLSCGKTD